MVLQKQGLLRLLYRKEKRIQPMNATCFKTRFLPLHRKLYSTAFHLLENADDAEDVVQEAYAKLWDRRETLYGVENDEAFCVTLVKRLCFDLLRSSGYRLRSRCVELEEAGAVAGSEAETREDADLVKQIVGQLPPLQRRIVMWRDADDLAYEEIAQLTGLTAGHVRVMLSRLRKKIREEFFKRRGGKV